MALLWRGQNSAGILNKNLASIRCYQTTKLLLIFPVTKNHYTALHIKNRFKLQPNLFIAPKYPHAKLDTLFLRAFHFFRQKTSNTDCCIFYLDVSKERKKRIASPTCRKIFVCTWLERIRTLKWTSALGTTRSGHQLNSILLTFYNQGLA